MLNRGTNRAKELVRSSLNRVGLDLVRFPAPHTIAHHLQKFLLQEGINLILDVGAYHGSYCALLREKAGYRGRIVSFEPHRNSFDILNAGMADDENWQGYGFGISDNDRTATLNVYEGRGDFNSLLDLREQGAAAYDVDASRRSADAFKCTPWIRSGHVWYRESTARAFFSRSTRKVTTPPWSEVRPTI